MCHQACHYVLTNPDDPPMTPSFKGDQLRKIFKRYYDWTGRVVPWWVSAKAPLTDKALDGGIALRFGVTPAVGTVPGDAKALRATFVNILENSLEACRAAQGKQSLQVTMSVCRLEPWMVFVVEDNGAGMERETRERIFSLFFSSKGSKGTGLGLFVANKIVDKHGGSITVDSKPRRGSRSSSGCRWSPAPAPR